MGKKFLYTIMSILGTVAPAFCLWAQDLAPRPGLWYSFDGNNGHPYNAADYGSAVLKSYEGRQVTRVTDRFHNSMKAVSFSNAGSNSVSLIAADSTGQYSVKLFGYSNQSANLPDDFTISCWVYVLPHDTVSVRKIFYTDADNSRFALLHKGSDIYLRRIAWNAIEQTYKPFDYYFGAPASFDAGAGWYHVILVMARRTEDSAKYSKLYIGKPGHVKYDATGPRVIADSTDVLAMSFGGSYAFTGVQDFMNTSVSEWGLGNADTSDPVHSVGIGPVPQMDDFTVWNVALSEMAAYALFKCQRLHPADQCWISNTASGSLAAARQMSNTTEVNTEGHVLVYPNPTTGDVYLTIPAEWGKGTVVCTLLDVQGKIVFTKTVPAGKATQTIRLDNIKSVAAHAGIYFLKIQSVDKASFHKLLIQ